MNQRGTLPAFKDDRGRFTGKARLPRIERIGFKTCSRCHDEKPVEQFSPDKKARDGLHCWCRPCRTEDIRVRRQAAKSAMSPEDRASRVWRMDPAMLVVKTKALLAAAREARELGMWRGRAAIRAYRDLGDAMEALHVPAPERADSIDKDAKPCTCPEWPCPRHVIEVELA